MLQYHYLPLSRKPGVIRLLRLLPSKDDLENLRCELFEYCLRELDKATHPYEALSYTWGGSEKPRCIIVDNRTLAVTHNLHSALSHLQEHQFPRIIWVDAVCINQADDREKEYQIRSMAEIYVKASRVIVWLGEARDNSDQALEAIRIMGEKITKPSNIEPFQQAILRLLQRQWFRHIWVLQEVAAARQVLIICGSVEIDGHAFCLGLESLGTALDETTCEATKRHDKVYALLGMCSDDLSKADLEPDYALPWRILMYRLVKFLLGDQVIVETWEDKEMAVIESRGCALGHVSSVTTNQDGTKDIQITFGNVHENLWHGKSRKACWSLPNTAKPIQKGDVVCLLQRAVNPTIIRPCEDYFTVIMIAASPRKAEGVESENPEWRDVFQLKAEFSRNFLLVWDWENGSSTLQISRVSEISRQSQGLAMESLNDNLNRRIRLRSVALILLDAQKYVGAADTLQNAIEDNERTLGKEHLATLELMDDLAMVYNKSQQWMEAEKLPLQILQSRKRIQGEEHQNMLDSLAALISTYSGLGYLEGVEDLQVIRDLDKRNGERVKIVEKELCHVAGYSGEVVMRLLLDGRGDEIQITEKIVIAAAKNLLYGKEMTRLLLDRRGDEVRITENVLMAAVGNLKGGGNLMTLLLDRGGDEVQITKGVVVAAAASEDNKVLLKLLLDRKGYEVRPYLPAWIWDDVEAWSQIHARLD